MNQDLDDITSATIGAGLKIHKQFGGSFLESAYELLLTRTLQRQSFHVERQRLVSFVFDGIEFNDAFRVDLLINLLVVVEVKSVTTPQTYRYFSINFCSASLPGHSWSNGTSTNGVVTVFDTACMSLPPSLIYNSPVATSCRI